MKTRLEQIQQLAEVFREITTLNEQQKKETSDAAILIDRIETALKLEFPERRFKLKISLAG